jgi:hypothetical protein
VTRVKQPRQTPLNARSGRLAVQSCDTLEPGLCGDCEHARTVASARGAVFWLCKMHDQDPAYTKYPRLPVRSCAAYTSKRDK